jgi:uncharacterized protein
MDWAFIGHSLLEQGYSLTPQVLSPKECQTLISQYGIESNFRVKINMEQFNFGKGEYKYFTYPLPSALQNLREEFYARLVDAANVWCERLTLRRRYPPTAAEFLEQCKKRNQLRPTPLMLKYGEGDFNCLHQDLYGDLFFPFQAVFGLSQPGEDYVGGELVLVQQRPRMQSVPHVISLSQGQAVIFAVNFHPQQGKRGYFRTTIKHGVSQVTRGKRFTLGIIFHDAK